MAAPRPDPAPPRYLPARPLPPYRHRPGHTPHPRTDPAGHSHGASEPVAPPLTPDNGQHHGAFLFGTDLFNRGYWWEAHEHWEAAWRATSDAGVRQFLRGLIQLAAALIKWEAGNGRGRAGLWRRAQGHLEAAGATGRALGADVAALMADAEALFAQAPVGPGRHGSAAAVFLRLHTEPRP